MNVRKCIAISSLIFFAFTTIHANQQEDFSSGAIKTLNGYLIVWNEPNNYYTLEIKGKNVRQTSTERKFFSVDGMFLQVVEAATNNFIKDADKKKMGDQTILQTHMDWELKYMESQYKEKLKAASSWQKLSSSKEALLWQVDVPESAKSNVKKQIHLTLVNGDYILMLGGVMTDTIEESATRQLLLNTAETLKPSDKPTDLRKLQEAIRKEAASKGTN